MPLGAPTGLETTRASLRFIAAVTYPLSSLDLLPSTHCTSILHIHLVHLSEVFVEMPNLKKKYILEVLATTYISLLEILAATS